MPPLNCELIFYERVWALLEINPNFGLLFAVPSRIKDTNVRPDDTDSAKNFPAAFPKIRLQLAESSRSKNPPRTFAHNSATFTPAVCDHGVPLEMAIDGRIIHNEKSVLGDQTLCESVVFGALLACGPNMGINWITNVEIRGVNRRSERSPETGGVLRPISRFRIIAKARPKLSLLTSPTYYF